jgi:hypothetical protein
MWPQGFPGIAHHARVIVGPPTSLRQRVSVNGSMSRGQIAVWSKLLRLQEFIRQTATGSLGSKSMMLN